MDEIVITDTSVLLNLLASGEYESIFKDIGLSFIVCPAVANEAQFLRNPSTGERVQVDLEPLIQEKLLKIENLETDEEFDLLIEFSSRLGPGGDGEAMCFTLAKGRGYSIAIDDVRAVKRALAVYSEFRVVDTIEILHRWQEVAGVSTEVMLSLCQRISQTSSFRPRKDHPLISWWDGE